MVTTPANAIPRSSQHGSYPIRLSCHDSRPNKLQRFGCHTLGAFSVSLSFFVRRLAVRRLAIPQSLGRTQPLAHSSSVLPAPPHVFHCFSIADRVVHGSVVESAEFVVPLSGIGSPLLLSITRASPVPCPVFLPHRSVVAHRVCRALSLSDHSYLIADGALPA